MGLLLFTGYTLTKRAKRVSAGKTREGGRPPSVSCFVPRNP